MLWLRVGLLLPILLCSCQHVHASDDSRSVNERLHPYLQQKLKEIENVVQQANLVYGDYEQHEEKLEMRVVNTNTDMLTRNINSSVATLRVFENTYVLVEDNILIMHEHESTVMIEFERIFKEMEGFTNVQSTYMADDTFILFLFADHLELYTSPTDGSWDTTTLAQSITNEYTRPVAVELLHCLGRLYLVVAYADQFGGTLDSLIYEWTGSHFDEVYEVSTAGAVDMAVILQADHFYVTIAERPPRKSRHCVSIYKITPGSPPLKHRIPISAPRRLLAYDHFHDQVETYLLVLNTAGKGTVLKLEGDEFIEDHTFDIGSGVAVTTLGYLEAVPVLVTAEKNYFHLSKVTHSGIVHELTLHVEGTEISMLELMEQEYGHYRVVTTFIANERLMLGIVSLAVRRNIIVRRPTIPPLETCIEYLSKELELRQNAIDQLSLQLHQMEISDDMEYDSLTLDHEVTISNSVVGELNLDTGIPLLMGEDEILDMGRDILEELRAMDEKLPSLMYKDKPFVIDYPVVLKGDLNVNKLEAEYMQAEKVNDEEFTSEHFVWDNQDSTNTEGETVIEELHVVNLTAPTIFLEGFLINPTVKSLKVNNIAIPSDQTVNGIYLDQIVLKGEENIIEGKKIIENVWADTVYAETLGDVNIDEVLSSPPKVQSIITSGDVIVDNLLVDMINDLNITEFMRDVFIRDVDTTIDGDITLNEAVEINELETDTFQGIPVEEMLTKTTDQIITSNVTFDDIFFEEAEIGLINGVNISKDVALLNKHNIIRYIVVLTAPVIISNLRITDNLILNCGKRQSRYCNLLDLTPEDQVQIYEAPVYIEGSLTINDLKFSNEATVIVNGQQFHTDFEKIFWMKSKKQRIPDGVTFAAGLTVSHMDAIALNGVAVEELVTINTDLTQVPVYFEQLYLGGDIMVQPWTQCAAVAELGRDVVTTHGDFVITGKKIFTGTVEVGHLIASTIDGEDLSDIALQDDPREKTFQGEVRAHNVEVKGDLWAYCDVEAHLVNEFPLRRVVERALRVDRDAYLETVTFTKSFEAPNIQIEEGPVVDALKSMGRLFEGINVTVDGELELTNGVDQVRFLNGIEFESYIGQVVDKSVGGLVAGRKVFDKGLQVTTALEAKTINGVDFRNIINSAVRKQGVQKITGKHEIENLYTDQLTTNYLNNLDVDNIVDASQPIVINSSLIFEDVNVFGNLHAETPFDLKVFKESITNLKARCWDEVNIDGGMDWDIPGDLTDILENAVHGEKKNVITGNVTFLTPVQAENVVTNMDIDGVDIQFIANDAVLKSLPEQEITGKKIFLGPTEIEEIYVERGFFSKNISGFDLHRINETMARKYQQNYFQGHVTFNGNVSTDYIKANSISGIPDLRELMNVETIRSIKSMDASRVRVLGDLRLNKINDRHFNQFLDSIVLTEGQAQHVEGDVEFEDLQIGELDTDTINNVKVEDIFFDGIGSNHNSENQGNLDATSDMASELFRSSNSVNLKEKVYKAIRGMDANIDTSVAVLAELEKRLNETKQVYEEMKPQFLYLELVKHLDVTINTEALTTATCQADECTVLHYTNLDCLRQCSCFLIRLITIDMQRNWNISTRTETLNRRSFLMAGQDNAEVASVEVVMAENNDNGCRRQVLIKWLSTEDYLNNDNSDVIDITNEIKGDIIDIKSTVFGDRILIAIAVQNRAQEKEESVIMVVEPQEGLISFQGRVPTCGATHVVTSMAEGRIHVFFTNEGKCEFPWAYSFEVESKKLIPGSTSISHADLIATATTLEHELILVVALTKENKTELIDLVYDRDNDGYEARQRIGETSRVVAVELVNIYDLIFDILNYTGVMLLTAGAYKFANICVTELGTTKLCSFQQDAMATWMFTPNNVPRFFFRLNIFEIRMYCTLTWDTFLRDCDGYDRDIYKKAWNKLGWQLKSRGRVEGATGLLNMKGSDWPFILVTSSKSSALLSLTSSGLR